jgi:enoyl-CoA hydratase
LTADILFEPRGAAGFVTLNRPQVLNALTYDMALDLSRQLDQWQQDPAVGCVVIQAAGERAFCAGGDIRWLYDGGKSGGRRVVDFYRDEYLLNAKIKFFPKPYVALLDGIVMGGGVGISIHGSHRIFTERATFAMPETGIGLFPDVGGSYFLSRCPGEIGTYLGLTGARIKAADALYCGIATHYAPQTALPDICQGLADGRAPDDLVTGHQIGAPPLAAHRDLIDTCFSANRVEDIIARLEGINDPFAAETRRILATKSPTSLKVTLAQLRAGRTLDFKGCMRMEYRLASRFMAGVDFYEGVRAIIIDKDQAPQWRPATLDPVDEKMVAHYFAALDDELPL